MCCNKISEYKKNLKKYLRPHLIVNETPEAYDEFVKKIYLKALIGWVIKIGLSTVAWLTAVESWD